MLESKYIVNSPLTSNITKKFEEQIFEKFQRTLFIYLHTRAVRPAIKLE